MMSYRDDLQAARMRKDALARTLEDVEKGLAERRTLDEKAAWLRREIAAAEELIEQARIRTSLPLLARVEVASQCPERWETMEGDDYVRFCRRCEKNVYDLSALDADRAEALLRERGEAMCITFYRRPDGTVLTQDCIGGTRRRARRRKGMAAAAGLAAGLGLAAATPAIEEHLMGPDATCELPVTERRPELRALGGRMERIPEDPSRTRERLEALKAKLEKLKKELKDIRTAQQRYSPQTLRAR